MYRNCTFLLLVLRFRIFSVGQESHSIGDKKIVSLVSSVSTVSFELPILTPWPPWMGRDSEKEEPFALAQIARPDSGEAGRQLCQRTEMHRTADP